VEIIALSNFISISFANVKSGTDKANITKKIVELSLFMSMIILRFIRLRLNTLQLAAGMNGVATRRSSEGEGGLVSANSALIPRSLLRGASFYLGMPIC